MHAKNAKKCLAHNNGSAFLLRVFLSRFLRLKSLEYAFGIFHGLCQYPELNVQMPSLVNKVFYTKKDLIIVRKFPKPLFLHRILINCS